jgi:hypothetical protein
LIQLQNNVFLNKVVDFDPTQLRDKKINRPWIKGDQTTSIPFPWLPGVRLPLAELPSQSHFHDRYK